MKISVIFSPVMKVSCRGHGRASVGRSQVPPHLGAAAAGGGWLQGSGWGGCPQQGCPHLCLVDLQQYWPGGEATVIEQHVRQDGQLGRGALQGLGFRFKRLLLGGGGAWRGLVRGAREKGDARGREMDTGIHTGMEADRAREARV